MQMLRNKMKVICQNTVQMMGNIWKAVPVPQHAIRPHYQTRRWKQHHGNMSAALICAPPLIRWKLMNSYGGLTPIQTVLDLHRGNSSWSGSAALHPRPKSPDVNQREPSSTLIQSEELTGWSAFVLNGPQSESRRDFKTAGERGTSQSTARSRL